MAELKMEVILQAFDRVTSVLGGIDGSISKTKKNISDYKKRLRELNDTVPKEGFLTAQQKKDQAELKKTERLIERQQKRLKDLYKMQTHRNQGKQMMGMGTMQIAAATAMGYGASRLMSEGMEFDTTMSRVQALTRLDKNDPMLAELRANAKALGASTWADPTQVAQGQAFYAMAGFKPEDIVKSMAGTLDLARAGDIDIARAADIGSNILSAFGLDASEMDRVGDILVGTFTRTNTNMEMLGDTMRYVAPIAKELGVSLEETSAMAGVLGNVGIQGTQAGTAMRAMLSRLAAGPNMARKELKALRINTSDKKGNMKDPVTILTEVLEKTSKMGNAKRLGILKNIAGMEAASAFASLLDKGNLDDLKNLIAELRSNKGESQKLAKVMADNLSGDIQELNSAWSDFKIAIFEVNSKGLRKTMQWLTKIMNSVGTFAKENPEIVRNLSFVAAGIMGITSALGLAKLAWGAFQFAVLGNPVIASIAAIGLAAYAVYKNFDQWVWLWREGFGFMQWEVENFLRRIPVVGNQLGNVWQVVSFFLKAVATGSETVVSGLKFLVDLAFDNENAWGKVITVWDELGMNVKQFWSDIPTWAQPAIDKVMAILQPFLDVYNHLTGKKPEFTVSQKLIHDYNTNPKAFNSHYLNKFNELNEKVPGLDKVVSQEQYLKAMQRGEVDEIKAKVLEFQRNALEVKNQTQTNTFQIHITAPDGNASNIAEAVKRGIASVTKNNDAFLGDTV